MMRDESTAAADIENARVGWNETRDFQCHIVGTASLTAPAFTSPTPTNSSNGPARSEVGASPRTAGRWAAAS